MSLGSLGPTSSLGHWPLASKGTKALYTSFVRQTAEMSRDGRVRLWLYGL